MNIVPGNNLLSKTGFLSVLTGLTAYGISKEIIILHSETLLVVGTGIVLGLAYKNLSGPIQDWADSEREVRSFIHSFLTPFISLHSFKSFDWLPSFLASFLFCSFFGLQELRKKLNSSIEAKKKFLNTQIEDAKKASQIPQVIDGFYAASKVRIFFFFIILFIIYLFIYFFLQRFLFTGNRSPGSGGC